MNTIDYNGRFGHLFSKIPYQLAECSFKLNASKLYILPKTDVKSLKWKNQKKNYPKDINPIEL